jgi:hypothetical protein
VNSALTRSAWVCSGNRAPSAATAGSSGLRPAATASGSPGRIRITCAPGTRLAISRYSALAGSTTSHGIFRSAAASSSARTVCDFPPPVAPQTSACRFSDSSGSANTPAGARPRSRIRPISKPRTGAGSSGVTSNSGRSASRTPGISASGGRASAASSPVEAQNGDDSVASPPGPCEPPGGTGAGVSRYGSPPRSAEAHSSPATRAAPASSAPPAQTATRHRPSDSPRCSSACRSASRRASAACPGNRPAVPSAARRRDPASSASAWMPARSSGSAITSQPNGPAQLPSSASSSPGPGRPAAPPASSGSLIPATSRQQPSRPVSQDSSAFRKTVPRAPDGSASSASPASAPALPASASPAVSTCTGPPAAGRIHPNATAPPRGSASPAW